MDKITLYNTEPVQMTTNELKHNMKYPVDSKNTELKSKNERVCPICLGTYTVTNTSNHKKTQRHKIYSQFNDKLRAILL